MADLLFIGIIVAFFALMVAFVRLCERVVGKDEAVEPDVGGAEPEAVAIPEEVPA